ncbi:hypothetical protein QET40_12450 [Akkermansia sp. N21169]|uniref:hypothetical protein n=1 Tax=Akkermansia sp. N21169 TaxID=3040765 RepID=UPI00244E5C65|nr:hypothetical protein [Akkermansia sp. N21169]MDH3069914.1 hypothetical protein [Akkermansia sp. N21169]
MQMRIAASTIHTKHPMMENHTASDNQTSTLVLDFTTSPKSVIDNRMASGKNTKTPIIRRIHFLHPVGKAKSSTIPASQESSQYSVEAIRAL